jgi:hypothetical protein
MKSLLLLAAATATLFLAGCGGTAEDKYFFGRGWVHPDDLDHDDDPPLHQNTPADPMFQP